MNAGFTFYRMLELMFRELNEEEKNRGTGELEKKKHADTEVISAVSNTKAGF